MRNIFNTNSVGGLGFGTSVSLKPRTGAPVTPETRTFQAFSGDSGFANLTSSLTINSLAGTLKLSLFGQDATSSSWPQETGSGLTAIPIASTGTDPTSKLVPTTTNAERAVQFENGKVYQAASKAMLGTDDFMIEALVKLSSADITSACPFIGTRSVVSSAAGAGWTFQCIGSGLRFIIRDGSSGISASSTLTADQWLLVHIFCDRNDSAGLKIYHNGALAVSADPSSMSAVDLDTTGNGNVTIGATTALDVKSNGSNLAYMRIWTRAAGWFAGGATNTSQWLAVAQERAARLFGIYPSFAAGTATPTSATARASAAYLDRVIDEGTNERRLFYVHNGWIRYTKRKEASGGEFLKGVLVENQKTNLLLQSETFDNASWTKTNCTISANSVSAPTGETTADALIGDASDTQHCVIQAATVTAATYTFSVFAKAGNQNHLLLENTTIANGGVWFNLSTVAVGTTQAGVGDATIIDFGNGWRRCQMRFTGTNAAHAFRISAAEADNDGYFLGDGATANVHLFGAQVELSDHAGSYIPTTTATVTRSGDTLTYKMDDGNFLASSPGSLSADILMANYNQAGIWNMAVIAATSNSTTPDSIRIDCLVSDFAHGQMNRSSAAEYDITGTTNISDGEKHNVKTTWETNAGKLLVDDVQQGSTDTSVTILSAAPALLTVGSLNNASGSNSVISNLIVKKVAT